MMYIQYNTVADAADPGGRFPPRTWLGGKFFFVHKIVFSTKKNKVNHAMLVVVFSYCRI